MASQRFNELQTQVETKLEMLRCASDYGERRNLLADLRKLITELDREVQGEGPVPRPEHP